MGDFLEHHLQVAQARNPLSHPVAARPVGQGPGRQGDFELLQNALDEGGAHGAIGDRGRARRGGAGQDRAQRLHLDQRRRQLRIGQGIGAQPVAALKREDERRARAISAVIAPRRGFPGWPAITPALGKAGEPFQQRIRQQVATLLDAALNQGEREALLRRLWQRQRQRLGRGHHARAGRADMAELAAQALIARRAFPRARTRCSPMLIFCRHAPFRKPFRRYCPARVPHPWLPAGYSAAVFPARDPVSPSPAAYFCRRSGSTTRKAAPPCPGR